jgi:phage-related minor tail protein
LKKEQLEQLKDVHNEDKQVDILKAQISENFAALNISYTHGIVKLSDFENQLHAMSNQFHSLGLQMGNMQKMLTQLNPVQSITSIDSKLKKFYTKYDKLGIRYNDYFRLVKTLQRIDRENKNEHGATFKNLED